MYLKNSLNVYFSLKRVSSPDWTLIFWGVKNSIPLKTDWIVSHDIGDEVQTIVFRILGFLTTFGQIDPGTSRLSVRNEHNRRVTSTFSTSSRQLTSLDAVLKYGSLIIIRVFDMALISPWAGRNRWHRAAVRWTDGRANQRAVTWCSLAIGCFPGSIAICRPAPTQTWRYLKARNRSCSDMMHRR